MALLAADRRTDCRAADICESVSRAAELVGSETGLASLAGQLMQSSTVRFFHEHVLVKEPGATEPTPWHHDDPYYGIDGLQNVSMWIALDPVPATSGLQFIAGSHLWGRRFVPFHRPHVVRCARRPVRTSPRRSRIVGRQRRDRLGRATRRRGGVALSDTARRARQRFHDPTTSGEPAVARRRRSIRRTTVDDVATVRTERPGRR